MVPGQRAAVPAVVSELMLALPDPLFGSLADGLHQVRVALAQLALLVHQAGNVVADHAGPQRSDVPGMDTIQQEIEESWLPSWKISSVQVHSVILLVNANAILILPWENETMEYVGAAGFVPPVFVPPVDYVFTLLFTLSSSPSSPHPD